MIFIYIGSGAFFGAISRFLISDLLSKIAFLGLPVGTLTVNILGCFLMGIFYGLNFHNKEFSETFIVIGFLGSFTTFSAFTKEFLIYFSENGFLVSLVFAISISIFCIISTFFGFKLVNA